MDQRSSFAAFTCIVAVVLLIGCSSPTQQAPVSSQVIKEFQDVDQTTRRQIAGFLPQYFELNRMLIEDSLAGAKAAAASFVELTKPFEVSRLSGEQLDFYFIHSSNLQLALKNLSESNDIEKARVELATVSEAMYALVKAFHPNESPLYYQYCPMARDNKGATWLSATKELMNPYMGQMMLACGRTQETIN